MAMAPSIPLFVIPNGDLTAVTLAGHGVMKNTPIFSGGNPVSSNALFLASDAASSTGACSGNRLGIRLGKRTRISLTTEGQAVLIRGHWSGFFSTYSLDLADTNSAAPPTSYTSSNPIFLSAVNTMLTSSKWLNCAYMDGAGNATL